MLNEDYRDILQCFIAERVEFLLVGAYALAAHGYPRATKDIDLWIWARPENAQRVYRALAKFGAPVFQIKADDFAAQPSQRPPRPAPVRNFITPSKVSWL